MVMTMCIMFTAEFVVYQCIFLLNKSLSPGINCTLVYVL